MFIDTSYLLALELKNDQNHLIAQKHWQQMILRSSYLVTTSYVFDELMTFFNSRGYHAEAVTIGNALLNSSVIKLIQIDESLFLEGWAYFQQHEDKTYSLTDCISFIVMQKFKINTALTFDKHFVQAGFLIEPT